MVSELLQWYEGFKDFLLKSIISLKYYDGENTKQRYAHKSWSSGLWHRADVW